jgi:hypothetical protein
LRGAAVDRQSAVLILCLGFNGESGNAGVKLGTTSNVRNCDSGDSQVLCKIRREDISIPQTAS